MRVCVRLGREEGAYQQRLHCQTDTLKSFKVCEKSKASSRDKTHFCMEKVLLKLPEEPISDLLRASVKWVPPLRNQTVEDLWKTP